MQLVHAVVVGLVVWFLVGGLARRIIPRNDPRLRRLVNAALVVKLLAVPVEFYLVDHLYGGVADANGYYNQGVHLANALRSGHFTYHGALIGDGATIISVALILVVIGTTKLGAALAFSGLAFVGLCCFYRAFTISVPEGNNRRYAWLIFFFPSVVFWSATFSKEAIMTLGLGVAALGAAKLLTRGRGAIWMLLVGFGIAMAIRPPIALILFAGVGVAFVVRRGGRRTPLSPFAKILGIVVIVGGGLFLANKTASFLHVSRLDNGTVQQVLNNNQTNLQSGNGEDQTGSSFQDHVSASPSAFPKDAVTVLFRPFPYEAHNNQELASSVEGLAILILFLISLRSMGGAIRLMRPRPYIAQVVVYSAAFIYAYSSLANFGLLNRERIQLLPLLFVLFALPQSKEKKPSLSTGRPRPSLIGHLQ